MLICLLSVSHDGYLICLPSSFSGFCERFTIKTRTKLLVYSFQLQPNLNSGIVAIMFLLDDRLLTISSRSMDDVSCFMHANTDDRREKESTKLMSHSKKSAWVASQFFVTSSFHLFPFAKKSFTFHTMEEFWNWEYYFISRENLCFINELCKNRFL